MSDNKSERGLLTDLIIFVVIVGLGLAAVYLTGNWDKMIKLLVNLDKELRSFFSMFVENIGSVIGVFGSLK